MQILLMMQKKKHKEEYEKKVETVKSSLKAAMESDSMHAMQLQAAEFEGSGGEFYSGSKGGRGSKTKGHRDNSLQHKDRRGV